MVADATAGDAAAMPSPTVLRGLAAARGAPLVSVFMPLDPAAPAIDGLIRWKNLAAAAEDEAVREGVARKHVKAMLERATPAMAERLQRCTRKAGQAVLLGPEGPRAFWLTVPPSELVVVKDRFCLRPLLADAGASGRFAVLALSRKHVQLWLGSRTSLHRVRLPAPQSLEQAVGADWRQGSLQAHSTGGGRTARFHGHGEGIDDRKPELMKFLRQVDDAVVQQLVGRDLPLVLAAVGYEATAYRQLSRCRHLLSAVVEGNPDELRPHELHARAWALVDERLDARRTAAIARVAAAMHTAQVVLDVGLAIRRAQEGRIGTLLVRTGEPMWGKVDATRGIARRHAVRQPGDDDLLDVAVAAAMATGAEVYAVAPQRLPGGVQLAALLRY